nr:peroxiredoxin-like [Onthophagus taurus]
MEPAPPFKTTAVINGEFHELSLKDYKGQYVVLIFYPFDFSIKYPGELASYSEHVDDFKKHNSQLLVCSTDGPYTHLALINTYDDESNLGPIKMPMLADRNHEISRCYGVLDEKTGNALRALFIIDSKGILRYLTINDPRFNTSIKDILELINAFKQLDKNDDQTIPKNAKNPPKKLKGVEKPSDSRVERQKVRQEVQKITIDQKRNSKPDCCYNKTEVEEKPKPATKSKAEQVESICSNPSKCQECKVHGYAYL